MVIEVGRVSTPRIMEKSARALLLLQAFAFTTLATYAGEQKLAWYSTAQRGRFARYRPGLRALEELRVYSPLAALGIRKQEVRALAAELGVGWHSDPRRPAWLPACPTTPTSPRAARAHRAGEELLKAQGFAVVRLRAARDICASRFRSGVFRAAFRMQGAGPQAQGAGLSLHHPRP
jgi:hypothetical protein